MTIKQPLLALFSILLFAFAPHDTAIAGGGDKGKSGGEFHFVELAPITLPIIDDNGVSQTLSLIIVIDAKNDSVADKVELMMPKLNDAFIQDMYGALHVQSISNHGVLKVDDIKKRLTRVTENVVGEEQINEILLKVIQQRPV